MQFKIGSLLSIVNTKHELCKHIVHINLHTSAVNLISHDLLNMQISCEEVTLYLPLDSAIYNDLNIYHCGWRVEILMNCKLCLNNLRTVDFL